MVNDVYVTAFEANYNKDGLREFDEIDLSSLIYGII